LLAIAGGKEEEVQRVNTEVAKPQVFDRSSEKVPGFAMVCKLYLRMKIREIAVEE